MSNLKTTVEAKNISLALANKMLEAVLVKAEELGIPFSIAIVDKPGKQWLKKLILNVSIEDFLMKLISSSCQMGKQGSVSLKEGQNVFYNFIRNQFCVY